LGFPLAASVTTYSQYVSPIIFARFHSFEVMIRPPDYARAFTSM
jgi:hypothetical protein